MAFALSLVRVGAVLLAASAVGWTVGGALFPSDRHYRAERLGWSSALGCGTTAAFVPLSFLVGARPTWIVFLVFAGLLLTPRLVPAPLTLPAGRSLRESRPSIAAGLPRGEGRLSQALLWSLIVLGIVLYALRALTEPMWANDFIAIWGLKGKTIFGAAGFPERLTGLEFAHPEYPLGLPLLYAGIAFLTGRWDDHAMALVFPLLQVATLAVLVGWLRRRGVSSTVAYLATAIVACFEPLYSAFLTGMAEVPLSFGVLLFGTALADALEGTDAGALRRLAFAAALIAAMKNEGVFLAAAGSLLALIFGKGGRWKIALAALSPALLVRALHLPWRSRLPLTDFEWSLFSMERVWDSLAAAAVLLGWATWAGLALLLVLIALGDRVSAGDCLLLLAACAVAAYLVIPAFAVRGPAWLIETTLLRTTAALVPLVAAGIAVRSREVGPPPPPQARKG
jgi:hypothetical protein